MILYSDKPNSPRRDNGGGDHRKEKKQVENIIDIANKIIDLDPYRARDAEETPESIAEKIKTDPESIILYLLEVVEDLQA